MKTQSKNRFSIHGCSHRDLEQLQHHSTAAQAKDSFIQSNFAEDIGIQHCDAEGTIQPQHYFYLSGGWEHTNNRISGGISGGISGDIISGGREHMDMNLHDTPIVPRDFLTRINEIQRAGLVSSG